MNINSIFYKIWFPKTTQDITIVAPPSYDDLKDADKKSPNYSLLDRLGDRDTVFTMGKLLSRKYQKANLHLMSSEDIKNHNFSRNFVVIGGPGGKYFDANTKRIEYFQGNELCRIFSDKIRSKISYSDDCESLIINAEKFNSEYNRDEFLIKDYGYFASFINPFYKKARVVLIHGIHTLGVMGSARVLDGFYDSIENFTIISDLIDEKEKKGKLEFESFFKVDVTTGEVECPHLIKGDIFWLKQENNSIVTYSINKNQNEIKKEIIQIIKLAVNESNILNKKEELNGILKKIIEWNVNDSENTKAVYNICLRNKTIPSPNIDEISNIIDQDYGA